MFIHVEVEAHLKGHGKSKGFFTVNPRSVEGDQPDLGSKQHGPEMIERTQKPMDPMVDPVYSSYSLHCCF